MSVAKYTFPSQQNAVKDFDLYETHEYEIPEFTTLPFRKCHQPTQTKASEVPQHNTLLETQEWKIKKQRIQTSFHSKLLDQHIQSVEKNLLQFFEKSFPQFKTFPKDTLLWHIYGQDIDPLQSLEKLNELIKRDDKYFEEKQRNSFLTQLFYQQSLYDFISLICNSNHTKLVLELAYISSFFCEIHAQRQQQNLSQDQIETLVDEALQIYHFSKNFQKLEFLTLQRCKIPMQVDQSELELSIKKLIRVLGNTIILVIQEYFVNRFSKQNQNSQMVIRSFNFVDISKDEYSDDENEFHFYVGNKKRKA